jgi:hypothetical protein
MSSFWGALRTLATRRVSTTTSASHGLSAKSSESRSVSFLRLPQTLLRHVLKLYRDAY